MNELILNTKLKTVAAVCTALFLTACGGGGGGGGSPDWSSTPTAPGFSNTGGADTPDTPNRTSRASATTAKATPSAWQTISNRTVRKMHRHRI